MVWMVPAMSGASPLAAVSGVVRDAHGVAQMGALVEVLAVETGRVSAAFTDMNGRYRIASLVPGKYRVRATEELFMPATRGNLRLSTGMRATVNLTLSMLSDPVAWMPIERRKPDEPGDDWAWTLRSAANRPILRVLGDGDVVVVSAGTEGAPRRAPVKACISARSGDGGFGEGGVHTVLALDRGAEDGPDAVVRTSMAAEATAYGPETATEIDAGYERSAGFAGVSRMAVSYASHPEMMSAGSTGDAMGMQVVRMVSAEKMHLGDAVDVEAGSAVYAIRTAGTALTAQPFLRVTVHPGEVWAVRYRLATEREVQGFDGLDSVGMTLPTAVACGPRLCTEDGIHQEIALSRRVGGGAIQASVYRDALDRQTIAGGGAMNVAELAGGGGLNEVVMDGATGNFRTLGVGTTTDGVSVSVTEPLSAGLWAALEYDSGVAMAMQDAGATGLAEVLGGLHPEAAEAATVAVQGRDLHSGTILRAAYRWQPRNLVTTVGPYAAYSDQAFLGFYLRQALRCGERLPQGLEATLDVTNLLAEGYQPFLSVDGRTLFLAQSPRTVEGGLSFTF